MLTPSNVRLLQFFYEFFEIKLDGTQQWYRCYGLEVGSLRIRPPIKRTLRHCDVFQDWTYDVDGLMKKRQMSGNDVPITEEERWFKDGVDVNSFPISDKHL